MSQSSTAVREPLLRIAKREGTTMPQKIAVRAIAILLALVVDALFIYFVTGLNPLAVYGVMWGGTFAIGMSEDAIDLKYAVPSPT